MKCPICGHTVPTNADRCPDCGYRCRTTRPQPEARNEKGYYTPPNKSSQPKGCCFCALAVLIPAALLLILIVVVTFSNVVDTLTAPIPEPGIFSEETWTGTLPDEVDEDCFSINHGAVTFLPERWEGDRVLRIPETVDGETVTALAPGCFRNCGTLTTIILPDTIQQIEKEAFAGCTDLRGLFLPQGTELIGPRAFEGCINLESIYIPGSITQIAPGCFDDCAALLYLFYEGDFESWDAIYSDYINPFTTAICLDGNYYQGAGS